MIKKKKMLLKKEKGLGFSTEPAAASPAPKVNIYDFYYNNINPMPTPREIEILESFANETQPELMLLAMEKAVENKARSMAYIKGILNSWRAKGITTRAEAEEESAAKSKTTNKEPEAMKNVLARFMEKHKQEKEEPDGI